MTKTKMMSDKRKKERSGVDGSVSVSPGESCSGLALLLYMGSLAVLGTDILAAEKRKQNNNDHTLHLSLSHTKTKREKEIKEKREQSQFYRGHKRYSVWNIKWN